MSDGSCDIYDLEGRQCRQTLLLGDGNVFPRYLTCETCDHFYYKKIQSPWPRKDSLSLSSRTILRGRCYKSMVGPSPATHNSTSAIMFKVNITCSTQQDCCTGIVLRPSSYAKVIQPITQPKQTNPQPNPNTTLSSIITVSYTHLTLPTICSV